MRVRPRDRPPTPSPGTSSTLRVLELKRAAPSIEAAATILAGTLEASGMLSIGFDDARARFRGLLRDRDQDGRLELDLADAALEGVIDLPKLEKGPVPQSLVVETTVDVEALARFHPITITRRDHQDVISGFLPSVLDQRTGELRPFAGGLSPDESIIEKVHFAVSDQTITLRALELGSAAEESKPPKVLFRFPDDYRSYKEEGVLSSPKERLSLADATALIQMLSGQAALSESVRLCGAFELLQQAKVGGSFASTASTSSIEDALKVAFVATPTKAWLGRQTLDLLSLPSSAPLVSDVEKRSTLVPPELVLATMLAEGFNIHWAKRATWRGLPKEDLVFGMHHLGLDLLGRTEPLAARYETPTNRDMNLFPPPPPKGPPALDYPTAPTFENLVKLGLLPPDFPLEVLDAKNLVEGQGDRIVYDVTFPTVGDAIEAVHATLAFCKARFVKDYDHRFGAGAHQQLSEREMSFAISSYYNGGWIRGRALVLRELSPERRRHFGQQNVDRSNNLSIQTNAMVRVGLFDLLKSVQAFGG